MSDELDGTSRADANNPEWEQTVRRVIQLGRHSDRRAAEEARWLAAAQRVDGQPAGVQASTSVDPTVVHLAAVASAVDESVAPPTALRKRLLNAAMQVFRGSAPEPKAPASLWVRWKQDALEVLDGLRWVVAEPAMAVRSDRAAAARAVRIRAPLDSGLGHVRMELARGAGEQFALDVAAELDAASASERVRISLFREDREYRSGFATHSGLRFANLNPGAYVMRIRVGGRDGGELPIRVEEAASDS